MSRILIIEDDQDCAESLQMVLKLKGYEATWARDGPSALALACTPTVVLLDLGLPGMTGYEVAEKLRQKAPSLHIIAVTGHGGGDVADRCRAAGIDLHLLKPLDLDEFFTVLDSVFGGTRHAGYRADGTFLACPLSGLGGDVRRLATFSPDGEMLK